MRYLVVFLCVVLAACSALETMGAYVTSPGYSGTREQAGEALVSAAEADAHSRQQFENAGWGLLDFLGAAGVLTATGVGGGVVVRRQMRRRNGSSDPTAPTTA